MAATIATGVVEPDVLSIGVIIAGLIGAIGWNLITFYLGLPTSSSHALVGGIAGAAVAKGGFDVLIPSGLRTIGVFIILSPLLGLALAMLLTLGVLWAVHRYRNVDRLNRGFRHGQLVSAAAFSLGHGGNDAQKTMGVILAVLISSGHLPTGSDVPLWVILSAHTAIGLGTLTGGWRIVKTMGSRITRLQPVGRPVGRCRPRRVGVGRDDPRCLADRHGGLRLRRGAALMDRRALFFLGAAVISGVLIPVCEPDYRWVPIFLSVVYTLLSLASWADRRSRTQIIDRPRSPGAEM